MPEKGEPWDEIAKDFDRVILPGFVALSRSAFPVWSSRRSQSCDSITHWQHPNFWAYFPANVSTVSGFFRCTRLTPVVYAQTTFECILADMYVGAVSNPGCVSCSLALFPPFRPLTSASAASTGSARQPAPSSSRK